MYKVFTGLLGLSISSLSVFIQPLSPYFLFVARIFTSSHFSSSFMAFFGS
jgi:hypothetical protein